MRLLPNNKNTQRLLTSRGFTIVELMVALTVLSTILLLSTMVLTNIGSLYAKGVNGSNLQNTNRTLASDISQAVQFSGNKPFPCSDMATTCAAAKRNPVLGTDKTVYSFCINKTRFSYILGAKLGVDSDGTNTPHVMWRDTIKNTSSCPPLNINSNTIVSDTMSQEGPAVNSQGIELIPDNVRISRFTVKQMPADSGVYYIDSWLALGDSDLLQIDDASTGKTVCKGGQGTQFCATSPISISVIRRLQ